MLLPLVPSVHPSARRAESRLAGRQDTCLAVLKRDRQSCRFCGLPAGDWQDLFHLNDDHDDWSDRNLAAACPLCHGVQHLADATADQEMRVIWLPEVTQNALNVLVRGIHLTLHAHGFPPTLAVRPIIEQDDLNCAWRAYAALERRAVAARSVIDADAPRDLAAALLGLSPADYAHRERLLGGLRLLHRGRCFRGGRDMYPMQLSTWATPTIADQPPS